MPIEYIPRIDWAHEEIHEGDSYVAVNDEATMQDAETINFAFKTPVYTTTKEIHMVIDFTSRAGGLLEILEAATWTAQSGTKYVPINRNRNSSNTSSLLENETTTTFTAGGVAYDVTTILTTNATTIEQIRVFGASNLIAQMHRGRAEFILKSNTTYVVRFTADGNTNGCNLQMTWYEHLPNIV